MLPGDLVLAQTQKACGVVVQDVAFLLRIEEWCGLDRVDRDVDCPRPYQLVRSPHDAFDEACVEEAFELSVEVRTGLCPVVAGDVDVDLGVSEQDRDHLVDQMGAVVHHIQPQSRVPDQHFFQLQGAGQLRSIAGRGLVGAARRSLPEMDTDRDVQFFGEREVRLPSFVVQGYSAVLR